VTDNSEPLPIPVIRGETLSIQISEETYARGINVCKRNFRGRLILNKGDKPYGSREVLTKLQQLWTNIRPWKMTPLVKGYFEFSFASYDDLRTVWSKGTLNLKLGLLRLFEWSKDFSARTQRQTHAHVWIRLLELPQEYCMDRTLREIASAIETPLLIDSATQNRVFRHYARILVDMDLSKQLFHEVMIEREGFSFSIEIIYERVPAFCTHCRNIGHHITYCRWLHPTNVTHLNDKQKKIVPQKQQTQKCQPKDNPDGIGSSKAFEAPVINDVAADNTIPHPDAIQLLSQSGATAGQEEERPIDVSTPEFQVEEHTVQQTDKEPLAVTFEVQNVEDEIHKERLPSTSVHVLEEITETQEDSHDVNTVAIPQPPFIDVRELERNAQTQTRTNITTKNVSNETEVQIMHDNIAPVRVFPAQHQDVQVSKNVQRDLDLWARIREYDQRTADEGFTQVLSKKQQQAMKKKVLYASYNTRAKGTKPPSQ